MKKNYLALLICLFITNQRFFSQSCTSSFIPDMALQASSSSIVAQIDMIYASAKSNMLANTPPSSSQLNSAISNYNSLNIVTNNGVISGSQITSFNQVDFINTFADYLKFNPSDLSMIERVQNTIWLVYVNMCNGTLAPDFAGYSFRNFGRKGAFCIEFLNDINKQRFLYLVEKNSNSWNVFWRSNYDYTSQITDGVIDSDFIFNFLEILVPVVKCFTSDDEQYRYMLTLKRYISRFASVYTNGTHDGLKPDGSGYHHWNNYEAYMYCYNSIVSCLKMFRGTSFQILPSVYTVFRDAIMHKLLTANDSDIIPLSLTGRSGNWDDITIYKNSLKDLAIIGGEILGLNTADPVLAGIYNRKYGVEPLFNYNSISAFGDGFYQNNFSNMGVFRVGNTIIINKGFNDQLWGSEIYSNSNRFGRYQGYGAMSIVYPGNRLVNGFNNTMWDWNFNPGATTKVLSWDKLLAGWNRIDEYSSKKFAGALQFNLKHEGFLDKVWGTYGMFAMDFQERQNLGWGGSVTLDTHDPSFTFKKSSFFFNDMIICLASNISNSDQANETVTTLYQNATTPTNVYVNNNIYNSTEITTIYSGVQDNWLLDSYGTGFYIVKGSGDLKLQRKTRATPSHNQTNPIMLNTPSQASLGYISHGLSPDNIGYEYVVIPGTNMVNMKNIYSLFQNNNTKPYEVLNKDNFSHVIKHKNTGIYAFALFNSNSLVPGNTNLISNDYPCLIMYQPNWNNTQMRLSLSNPDLGLPAPRSYNQFIPKSIKITLDGIWQLSQQSPSVNFVSLSGNKTTFEFLTYQGLPIEVIFEKTTLHAKDLEKSNDIVIFPNPSSDEIFLKIKKLGPWKISDISGRVLLSGVSLSKEFKINISLLAKGTYFFTNSEQRVKLIRN